MGILGSALIHKLNFVTNAHFTGNPVINNPTIYHISHRSLQNLRQNASFAHLAHSFIVN